MDGIRNALLTQSVGAIFLTVLLWALFLRLRPRPFFRWWTFAWGAFTVYLLLSALSISLGPELTPLKRAVLFLSTTASLLNAACLVIGVQDVRDPGGPSLVRFMRWLVPAALAAGLVGWGLSQIPGIEPVLAASIRGLPRQVASTAALAYVAAVFLQEHRPWRGSARQVLGVVCGVWAITQGLYTLLTIDTISSRLLGTGHPFRLFEPMLRSQFTVVDLFWLAGIAVGMVLQLLEEYKESAAALEGTTLAYQTLIETSPVAIFSLGADGRVALWNAGAEALFGWRANEARGAHPPAIEGDAVAPWVQLLSGKGFARRDATVQRRDGTTVVTAITAAPLRDAEGRVTGAVAIAADQSEVRRLEEQVRHAQKMEAIGQLAGGIAHDFNNLLTVIISSIHLLRDQLGSDHPASADVQEIGDAATRAADLTRRLLAFSRRQITQVEALSVNAVVEELDRLLRRLIGAEVAFELLLTDGLPPVSADPGELAQVITNLCVNARDATQRGGRIAILTSQLHSDVPLGGLLRGRPGAFIRLDVRDNGSGMTAEVLPRIFEPYFTTKPLGKGTGLGLATVYALVEKMGGQIRVESQPERGTTVSIFLPARPDLVVPVERSPFSAASSGSHPVLPPA